MESVALNEETPEENEGEISEQIAEFYLKDGASTGSITCVVTSAHKLRLAVYKTVKLMPSIPCWV